MPPGQRGRSLVYLTSSQTAGRPGGELPVGQPETSSVGLLLGLVEHSLRRLTRLIGGEARLREITDMIFTPERCGRTHGASVELQDSPALPASQKQNNGLCTYLLGPFISDLRSDVDSPTCSPSVCQASVIDTSLGL